TGTPAFTSTPVPVVGNGDYVSPNFTPTAVGTYRWIAVYSGDANNVGLSTACNDPNESVIVNPATPAIVTNATASASVGSPITDTATLSGGSTNPPIGGTIVFTLFGPDDATCAGPPFFTSPPVQVNGNGNYTSAAVTPALAGAYRWIATYSGDANNTAAATACNDPGETSNVIGLPAINIVKTVTPASLPEPGGTFTFRLVITNPGPVDVTITELTDNVYGDLSTQGTCTTAIGTVLLANNASTYECTFPGDFTGVAGQAQTDIATVVGEDEQGNEVTDNDDAVVTLTPNPPPQIDIVKTASPASLPEPGGTFTFSLVITNPGPVDVTITELTDDVYGDLSTKGTCTTAIGTVLAANGGTYSCTFPGDFNGVGGDRQTDVATVKGRDEQGRTVTADDDAVVAITSVAPSITVVKTVTPGSLPEPGGTFTFSVTVNNTSTQVLTLTSLVDDIYGDLNGKGTCSVPQTLAVGGSYTCTFPGDFTGRAGDSQTDTVTGKARNPQG
ncbi:MAG: hypothetical protein LC708_02960, partial [Actinobacteria bacterium]|nr:hypothetical protein [Actinomycetota bacterium]